ncbi:MAG: GNAT family N-acetyltransferase [Pyrinomonadaceae bacterium]
MNFQIETAKQEHIPAIVELMREFAEYENLLESLEITAEKLYKAVFGDGSFVECLIVTSNETPVGYALYYLNFSSFRGQTGVYLEDIYIKKDFRKYGIGELMIKQIARAGKAEGAQRMDFQVLDWNTSAINFYKKHGAVIDESERHFKFTDEAFEKLAAVSSGGRQEIAEL